MNVLPPVRVRREYTQTLRATPDRVFPLLCPVREVEWAAGWEPLEVYTASGLIEPDCVFTTADEGRKPVWVVTRHDAGAGRLEIIKVTPELATTKIEIALSATGDGTTAARVAYTHTALSAEGRQFVERFDEAAWLEFMRTWEAELNHHLTTSEPLDETSIRYE